MNQLLSSFFFKYQLLDVVNCLSGPVFTKILRIFLRITLKSKKNYFLRIFLFLAKNCFVNTILF